ncbi:MAG: hypothetical protein IH984_14790 [Planctomycetes bacterium]|nr:hypothetical protein [Planctomycetota bacterium]
MKHNYTIISVILFLLALMCLVGAERFGLINLGLSSGYYGEYNKAMAVLRKHENVQYIGWLGNKDITLEDFSIDVRINQQWLASFYVPDGAQFAESEGVLIRSRTKFGYGWFLTFGVDGNLAPYFDGTISDINDFIDRFDEIVMYLQINPEDVLNERHYGTRQRGNSICLSIEGLGPK